MEQQLIDLLKNNDHDKIKLGCHLAKGSGYSNLEIFKQLWGFAGHSYVTGNQCRTVYVDYLSFIISESQTKFVYFAIRDDRYIKVLVSEFIEGKYDEELHGQTRDKFAIKFIDLILKM